jgi:hypothetical protein
LLARSISQLLWMRLGSIALALARWSRQVVSGESA